MFAISPAPVHSPGAPALACELAIDLTAQGRRVQDAHDQRALLCGAGAQGQAQEQQDSDAHVVKEGMRLEEAAGGNCEEESEGGLGGRPGA